MAPPAPPLPAERVADFVWRGEEVVTGDLLRAEDAARWHGQFAVHLSDGAGGHLLARDRLGVNKLFFAVTAAGEVRSANYLAGLLRAGHTLREVWSVPPGHAVHVAPARSEYRVRQLARLAIDEAGVGLPEAAAGVRAALAATFARLAARLRGRRVFVTLSGGLDSSAVAVLAREHLGAFTALTFALDGEAAGTDLAAARVVARALGVPIEVVSPAQDDVLGLLDRVLVHGQDWRDFNVHCGLVNAAIGRHLQARHGGGPDRPVVLTGDTMNELLADYTPVVHRGVTYYGLPNLPLDRLRRALVSGLDAGDREVGILHAFGIDVLQPYAMAADAIAAVSTAVLAAPQAKQQLMRAVLGDRIPAAVYARPKVRAQVGSETAVGGTLGLLAARGIDAAWLQARFAALLGVEARELRALIRAGMYRRTTDPPWTVGRT